MNGSTQFIELELGFITMCVVNRFFCCQIQDEDGVYGTVMVCPSVTPQGRSNPSFRVFTMDASTFQLQRYQQYHLNLTLANGRGNFAMGLWLVFTQSPYLSVHVNVYSRYIHGDMYTLYIHV